MCGGDKDRATRVSPLTNEEPLVVVEACVDIVREVIRKDCGDGCNGMFREWEASLRRSRCGGVRQRTSGVEDGYIGCDWGVCSHWGSEVFASRGSDEYVVGVDSNVFVKWGEEEGVEDFLSNLGGSGRHR